MGHDSEAADHLQQALILFRQIDHSLGQADALSALGVVILGLYPKPLVMAALRVAAPLF